MADWFVDKCDCCGAWKQCKGINGHLMCQECINKTGGRLELEKPVQAALFGLDAELVDVGKRKKIGR